MTCLVCGETMVTTREDYYYTPRGLPPITLRHVKVRRCPHCGDTQVVIPSLAAVHLAVLTAHVDAQET
jgi:YgiT-type zinc finger domain-containing protein